MAHEGATADVLAQAASALRTAARSHKRLEAQHRRQARDLMQQLDRLRVDCEELGITIQIGTDPKEGSQP